MLENFKKLYEKYGLTSLTKTRADLTKDEERKFVNDCFCVYEHIGFANTFKSLYNETGKYENMKFAVLNRVKDSTEDRNNGADIECLPAWNICFDNGDIIAAYPEEICLAER